MMQPTAIQPDHTQLPTLEEEEPKHERKGSKHGSRQRTKRTETPSEHQGNSLERRRVRILVDEPEMEMVPYMIPEGSITRVCFTSRTWDIMVQNFRIALEMDNMFICDHFLGKDAAERLSGEMQMLKEVGLFERHMRRSTKATHVKYASLFLQEPNSSHAQLDGLALMIKKLAMYYDSAWKTTSLQISYYPQGHPESVAEPVKSGPKSQRLLRCLYFPNRSCDDSGAYGKHLRRVQGGSEMTVDAMFDRLVVFWSDTQRYKATESQMEDFVITIWINR